MTFVGILCFLALTSEVMTFLITTILYAVHTITLQDRLSIRAIQHCGTMLLLFAAYTMLINIIWQYVININSAIAKKKESVIENDATGGSLGPHFPQ